MSRIHSVEFRERALALVDAGESISEVASRLGVHHHTIDNWLRLREMTGSLKPRAKQRMVDDLQREILRSLVEANPAATQRELAEMLVQAGGVRIDATTIGRELSKMGFVRKKSRPPRRVAQENSRSKPGGYRTSVRTRERGRYPSDLTDAQWALISPFIPPPKPGGRPTEHDRRTIVDAILYVTRTGCQWRALPHDFPCWATVYDLFRQWNRMGVWEKCNTTLRERCRIKVGRDPTPSAAIIDSQVARTTEKGGSVATTGANASRDASATSSSTPRASC